MHPSSRNWLGGPVPVLSTGSELRASWHSWSQPHQEVCEPERRSGVLDQIDQLNSPDVTMTHSPLISTGRQAPASTATSIAIKTGPSPAEPQHLNAKGSRVLCATQHPSLVARSTQHTPQQ